MRLCARLPATCWMRAISALVQSRGPSTCAIQMIPSADSPSPTGKATEARTEPRPDQSPQSLGQCGRLVRLVIRNRQGLGGRPQRGGLLAGQVLKCPQRIRQLGLSRRGPLGADPGDARILERGEPDVVHAEGFAKAADQVARHLLRAVGAADRRRDIAEALAQELGFGPDAAAFPRPADQGLHPVCQFHGSGVAGDVVGYAPGLELGEVKVAGEVHQEQHRRAFPAVAVRQRWIQKYDGGTVAFQLPGEGSGVGRLMDGETRAGENGRNGVQAGGIGERDHCLARCGGVLLRCLDHVPPV